MSEGMNSKATWKTTKSHSVNLFDMCFSPPAERIIMIESAGMNEATFLLQPLDDILVSILSRESKQLMWCFCVGVYIYTYTVSVIFRQKDSRISHVS